jgi:F-box protein 18 (helicase)
MKTEPTDAEINEGIAKFCGWWKCACGDLECGVWYDIKDESQLGPPSFTTSFDALRGAMGKMTEQERNRVLLLLHRGRPSDFEYWVHSHARRSGLSGCERREQKPMTPTPEQQAILDFPLSRGEVLKINAYAGAGKTSTLCAIAEKHNEPCLYLAFNKSVESDALMRFPVNTTAKTGHALAWKHIGRKYSRINNLYNWQLGKHFHLSIYEASLLLRSYENFLCSADPIPLESHILPDHLGRLNPLTYVEGHIQFISRLFDDMKSERGGIPMTHSCYLKMFQLSKPELGFPLVLLDEAQDTNPVMHKLVLDQCEMGSRLYLVGDPYQQIYSWRGAQDAMKKIPAPELRLSQSFRFGESIADLASRILSTFFDEQIPLRGLSSALSVVGAIPPRHTVLCRTNGGIVREAYTIAQKGATLCVIGEQAFDDVLSSVGQIFLLFSGKRSEITENRISRHLTFKDLKAYAEETIDAELMSKILIVEEYGSSWPAVEQQIKAHRKGMDADTLLSTCHKAKGLEWDNVRLSSDFAELFYKVPDGEGGFKPFPKTVVSTRSDDECEVHSEEVNLIYVAATRAKKCLQLTPDLKQIYNLD